MNKKYIIYKNCRPFEFNLIIFNEFNTYLCNIYFIYISYNMFQREKVIKSFMFALFKCMCQWWRIFKTNVKFSYLKYAKKFGIPEFR